MSANAKPKDMTRQESNKEVIFYGLLLFILLLLMGGTFLLSQRKAAHDAEYIALSGELRILSQAIPKNASEAAAGGEEGFRALKQTRDQFDEIWNKLNNGDEASGLPSSDSNIMANSLSPLQKTWDDTSEDVSAILARQKYVLDLHQLARDLSEAVPNMQSEYNNLLNRLIQKKAAADTVYRSSRQIWFAERIVNSVQQVLNGGIGADTAAQSFNRDATTFGRVLQGMLQGDSKLGIERINDPRIRENLQQIAVLFSPVQENIEKVLETSPELEEVRAASDSLFQLSRRLLQQATNLQQDYQNQPSQRLENYLMIAFALAALGILILLNLRLRKDANSRVSESDIRLDSELGQNQKNQEAIIRLLDEMGDLADGDLTVQATVTEDFTGAIADSINYSIEALRNLVTTIKQTATQVASATDETQNIAAQLANASESQAQEIAGASAAINEMAVSIEQVSSNASESAKVAEASVQIANKGSEVVQGTIGGMDTIREQIQETSKKIKRLGESSQEIGDILSLINDIADQTNILALNAAIQASMAGEAGRGFAVVADEVQRLAERSSNATKQIETLIKTIQSDTNEAVISMEQTTSEVVKGARQAEDAGVALEEIETVSNSLADLIQNISNAARQQAASAGHISSTMNVIQEITSQTSSGTSATAKSIGEMTSLADELRRSVAGFKLPQ